MVRDHTQAGAGLLQYLLSQAMILEYLVPGSWESDSAAIRAKRCTLHYVVVDYPACDRQMERAGIVGDTPC
jgi:taurine dioxygenase